MLRVGVGVVLSLVIGGLVVAQTVFGIEIPIIGRYLGGGGRGTSSYSSLGIDKKAADPDKLIEVAGNKARKWRKDAVLYSVSFNNLKTDGTLDFSKSATATIEYFSPELVGSSSKTKRDKSIKKYIFSSAGMTEQQWGVKKAYPNVPGTPVPACEGTGIAKVMKEHGVTEPFLASLDPGFAFATEGLSYNVQTSGGGKRVHLYLDINTCAVIKEM